MARSEWREMFKDLLDGVERELCSSAPIKTKLSLNAFRERLDEGRIARRRKRFEQELEAFLQNEPYLRGAAKRYLGKKTIATIEAAVELVKRAAALLPKHKTNTAEKLSALQTAEFFASRKARADFQAFDKIMRRRGGEKPRAGDELPPRSKKR